MTLYHEAARDTLQTILRDGLKRASRGKKGNETAIQKTDAYLDQHRPDALKAQGVSRDDNIYAYLGTDDQLIDIRDGGTIHLVDHPDPASCLLKLSVDSRYCYVSDLDRYDTIKRAIEQSEHARIPALATDYWRHVIPLPDYQPGTIRRPEVMITCDITPGDITPLDLA